MEHCRWKRQIQCQIDLFTPIKNIYIDEIDESGEITAQMHACEHFFQAKQMIRSITVPNTTQRLNRFTQLIFHTNFSNFFHFYTQTYQIFTICRAISWQNMSLMFNLQAQTHD